MLLFRFLPAALLVVCVLPCGAQTLPRQPSMQSVPLAAGIAGMEGSPCIPIGGLKSPDHAVVPKQPCVQAGKNAAKVFVMDRNSTCYAIRDYQFGIPKVSEIPKLKNYSTCVPAARFEARNVTVPVTVQAANPKR